MTIEAKISAGSYDLNKFLAGGYETDIITTIYGPGGSGKTNLCMLVAVSQAKKGNQVIYLDTEGGFSPERFKQIHRGTKEEMDAALEHVLLLKPTSFEEQTEAFQSLVKAVKKGNVALIIIDSIAMLYRLELGSAITSKEYENISQVNRELAGQLRILNEISRKQGIPIIITNQVYSSFVENSSEQKMEKQISMVGGDILKYWSKCLLEIQHSGGKRRLIIKKHRSMPQKELSFEITSEGIRKKGLF